MRLGRGEGVKISVSNLFNYFSVSGDSKQIKISHKKSGALTTTRGGGVGHYVGGTTQKHHFFLTPPLKQILLLGISPIMVTTRVSALCEGSQSMVTPIQIKITVKPTWRAEKNRFSMATSTPLSSSSLDR